MFKKQFQKQSSPITNAGFTMVELITVIVIVGVLAAMAAPGWFAFANTRRANIARDQILQILRQTQAEATRSRQVWIVKFDTTANPPQITTRRIGNDNTDNTENSPETTIVLGEGNDIRPGVLGMQAIQNNAIDPNRHCNNTNCIAFDADGSVANLMNNPDPDDRPIKITVFATNAPTTTKRCVLVRSLLGAMQPANNDRCN